VRASEQAPVNPVDQDVLLARAYLLRVAEPPAPALVRFVAEHGPVVAAEAVRRGRVPAEVAAETQARREVWRPEQDLQAAAEQGARLLVPEDGAWPYRLFGALGAAAARGVPVAEPLALWVRGELPLAELVERSVAVVGARAATGYGEQVAAELGHGLVERGWSVVSGAAYGIDGAAHRGALAAGGPTVAVLGCALDVGYPAGHQRLLDRIAESGAVVSEYPPGTPPARHRFLARNRLIAALTGGTVVVEAGRRSGARNTAAFARALGRLVMAVPGPVTSAMSVGCHAMLRDQEAILVGDVDQVLETVGRIGLDLVEDREAPRRPTDGLEPQALRVYEALERRGGRSAERVALEAGVPLDRVRALLPALELAGLAERCDEGWRRARPSPRSPRPRVPEGARRSGDRDGGDGGCGGA